MDNWIDKFEPLIKTLLKTKITYSSPGDSERLNFYMSKLDLEDHKTKIFEVLTELHYCDCCNKHQIDKPCIPTKWVSKKILMDQNLSCTCDCRHTARNICRMCD